MLRAFTVAALVLLLPLEAMGQQALAPGRGIAASYVGRIGKLLRDADRLYAHAADALAHQPRTKIESALLYRERGDSILIEERILWNAIDDLTLQSANLAANLNKTVDLLGEVRASIHAAQSALWACRGAQATGNLSVAKELLDHAHIALDQHLDPRWKPGALRLDPQDQSQCE